LRSSIGLASHLSDLSNAYKPAGLCHFAAHGVVWVFDGVFDVRRKSFGVDHWWVLEAVAARGY
jgi:hypothetical protein